MSTVKEHYDQLLAEHYTWMFGTFEGKSAEQKALFERLGIVGDGIGRAVDLGCGPGAQSVALARLGFRVTSIDFSKKMLAELASRKGDLPIDIVEGDIRHVSELAPREAEFVVCMGDTLAHLDSKADVETVLAGSMEILRPRGRVLLSFRDQSVGLEGLDRFISIQTSENAIMTCCLAYESETIVVNDLIHVRDGERWTLRKSSYRKLRLHPDWVIARVTALGYAVDYRDNTRGLVTLMAHK